MQLCWPHIMVMIQIPCSYAGLNSFIHDHRCISAPTSPIPGANRGLSPTSFGFKRISTGSLDHESKAPDDDIHVPQPLSASCLNKPTSISNRTVPALSKCRIQPPPLALHLLKLPEVSCPAVSAEHMGNKAASKQGHMEQHSTDPPEGHTTGPDIDNKNTIDNSTAFKKLNCALCKLHDEEARHSAEQQSVGKHDSTRQEANPAASYKGTEDYATGALTFRDMLGNTGQGGFGMGAAGHSLALSDIEGGITFRHMLDGEKAQKRGDHVTDDSSAHSTNTLQADPASRMSTEPGSDNGKHISVKDSALLPPLTFRDMLHMSPPCMEATKQTPASALSSASALTTPVKDSELSFGSSIDTDNLSLSNCEAACGDEQLESQHLPVQNDKIAAPVEKGATESTDAGPGRTLDVIRTGVQLLCLETIMLLSTMKACSVRR